MRSPSLLSCLMVSLALAAWLGCNPPATETPEDSATSEPDSSVSAEPDAPQADTATVEAPLAGGPDEAAAGPTLSIGDPAPTLAIAQWMKGQPIESLGNGKVSVVEFWATWCGPCRQSMPHMSQLQDKFGEQVAFVGISDETEATVQEFFDQVQDPESGKTWNDVLTYAIALDDSDKNTNKSYMVAAQQNGIPTAFIVGKDGYVEWIGHPMEMDEPLEQVVSGQWDRAAARAKFQDQQKLKELSARMQMALAGARATGDWSELDAIVAEIEQLGLPPQVVKSLKFQIAMFASKYSDALAHADELATTIWDEPQPLNELAWTLVTRVPPENQNYEQALRIALRACELTANSDASTLDTLARVYAESGDLEKAVQWQRKAVEITPDLKLKDTLADYERRLSGDSEPAASTELEPTDQPDASAAPDVEP